MPGLFDDFYKDYLKDNPFGDNSIFGERYREEQRQEEEMSRYREMTNGSKQIPLAAESKEGVLGSKGGYLPSIYSPDVSKRFLEAYKIRDIYEMRRITNYYFGGKNEFRDNYASKSFYDITGIPRNKVMEITADPNIDGLEVQLHKFLKADPNTGAIIPWIFSENAKHRPSFLKGSANALGIIDLDQFALIGDLSDMYYPVDVKAYPPSGKSTYYGDYQFSGIYKSFELITPIGGTGGGEIWGYMKGWGFCQYKFTITDTKGVSIGVGFGSIWGNYLLNMDTMDPTTIAGKGRGLGGGFKVGSLGVWEGLDDKEKVIWKGGLGGIASGIPKIGSYKDISGSYQKTYTSLLFPAKL